MRSKSLFILTFTVIASAQQRPEWDDVSVLHVGIQRPHTTMMVYPTANLP